MPPYFPSPPASITIARFVNYYDHLSISRTATDKQILKAWKAKSRKTHPDRRGPFFTSDIDREIWQRECNIVHQAMDTLLHKSKRADHNRAVDEDNRQWRNMSIPANFRSRHRKRRDKAWTDHF